MDNKKFIKLINVSSRIDTDILVSQLQAAGIISMVKTMKRQWKLQKISKRQIVKNWER